MAINETLVVKPTFKLYTPLAVGLATFLGTPIAGTYLMRQNFRHMEQKEKGNTALIAGILGTAALIGFGSLLPDSMGLPLSLAGMVSTRQASKIYFEDALKKHAALGGELESNWKAAGIGLLGLVAIFAIAYLAMSFA